MKRFTNPVPQFLKNNGDLASGGKLYFYQSGSDVTFKTIYSDEAGTTPLANPVNLTNEGRVTSIYGDGEYRVKFYDQNNVLQWSREYDFSEDSAQFEEWNSQISYSINDVSRGGDGNYYISQTNGNLGNDPTNVSSSGDWSQIALLEVWNADKVGGYANDAVVIRNGRLYASNTAGNTTTPPDATWDDLSFNNAVAGDFSVTGDATFATVEVQNSAEADPLKLDWYQEGTFTPVINGSSTSGTGTYSTQLGQYTRIGNVVYFSVILSWSAHTGTGNILIGGLPFASAAYPAPTPSISIGYSNITATAGNQIGGRINNSVQHVSVEQYNPAGAVFAAVPIDTSAGIWASGFYFV